MWQNRTAVRYFQQRLVKLALSGIQTQSTNGERWLYGNAAYSLALPPRALIDRWQNVWNDSRLDAFISGLVPQHPQYAEMHQALKTILADNHPWPQLTGIANTCAPVD